MILRRANATDAASLHAFDIGDTPSTWMAEVAEIVSGLVAWQADAAHAELDRQVVVLTDAGDVVAVAAHERQWNETGSVFEHHRYLMVTAVRADRQRHGLARLLVESVLADLQASGTLTVTWLVHPRNIRRSRSRGGVSRVPMKRPRRRIARTSPSCSASREIPRRPELHRCEVERNVLRLQPWQLERPSQVITTDQTAAEVGIASGDVSDSRRKFA